MKTRSLLLTGVLLVAIPALAQDAELNYDKQWGWGANCDYASPGQQSPIYIMVQNADRAEGRPPFARRPPTVNPPEDEDTTPDPVAELLVAPRDFRLGEVPLIVENKGHTVGVYSPFRYSLQLGRPAGASYTADNSGTALPFQQVHFHKPAEHRIYGAGGAGELEAHLVFNAGNAYAVIAVRFIVGAPNDFLAAMIPHVPAVGNRASPPDLTIDLTKLLPSNQRSVGYIGSLTTPNCTRGVQWHVVLQPMTASPDQLIAMGRLIGRDNARRLQDISSPPS